MARRTSTCASSSACCATRRSARSRGPRRRSPPRCTTGRGSSPIRRDPIASFARERADDRAGNGATLPPSASPEIAQIIEGLSRTTARIWVIDRDGAVLARAGSLAQPRCRLPNRGARASSRATIGRLYALVLDQPYEDFNDDAATQGAPRGRDVEGALAGILTTDRRPTSDGKAMIVSAAHPVWVGDEVRGVVIAEETGNAVLARAQSRVRAALQHRARRAAGRLARAHRVCDVAVVAHPPVARRRRARDRRRRTRARAVGELATRATRSATCRAASAACWRGCPSTRATRRRWRAACRTSCARRSRWCGARSTTSRRHRCPTMRASTWRVRRRASRGSRRSSRA